jgi:DNA-binding MarR family transcriptional regulator
MTAGTAAAGAAAAGSGPAAPPRWLTGEEQHAWRAYLALNQLLYEALDRRLQRDAGLPHAYYMLLAMLSEAPGRALRMSELARVTGTSQSRISHAVARLETLGHVTRRRCGTDGRGNVATLTDEGYAALAAAAPGHVDEVRRSLFDHLSAEQVAQLGEVCDAVLGALDPDRVRRLSPSSTNRKR